MSTFVFPCQGWHLLWLINTPWSPMGWQSAPPRSCRHSERRGMLLSHSLTYLHFLGADSPDCPFHPGTGLHSNYSPFLLHITGSLTHGASVDILAGISNRTPVMVMDSTEVVSLLLWVSDMSTKAADSESELVFYLEWARFASQQDTAGLCRCACWRKLWKTEI